MFDFGWPELLIIAIVLIIVVGPKDLPRVLRGFGRTTTKLRSMAGDFRKQFDEALREAELDEVKGLVEDARKLDPRREIKKHFEPLEKAGRDIRAGLDGTTKPLTGKPSDTKPAEAKLAEAKPAAPGSAGAAVTSAANPSVSSAKPATGAARAAAEKSASAPTARKVPAGKAGATKAAAKAPAKSGAPAKAPARRAAAGKAAPKTPRKKGSAS